MYYKVVKIKKDPKVWKITGETLGEMGRRTGLKKSFLSSLRSGRRIVSEQLYLKYRKIILGS